MDFIAELYQMVKEGLTPMLLNLGCKIEKEGTFPSSSYKASITLNTEPHKHTTK
jgi:hypothetical protein